MMHVIKFDLDGYWFSYTVNIDDKGHMVLCFPVIIDTLKKSHETDDIGIPGVRLASVLKGIIDLYNLGLRKQDVVLCIELPKKATK